MQSWSQSQHSPEPEAAPCLPPETPDKLSSSTVHLCFAQSPQPEGNREEQNPQINAVLTNKSLWHRENPKEPFPSCLDRGARRGPWFCCLHTQKQLESESWGQLWQQLLPSRVGTEMDPAATDASPRPAPQALGMWELLTWARDGAAVVPKHLGTWISRQGLRDASPDSRTSGRGVPEGPTCKV